MSSGRSWRQRAAISLHTTQQTLTWSRMLGKLSLLQQQSQQHPAPVCRTPPLQFKPADRCLGWAACWPYSAYAAQRLSACLESVGILASFQTCS